MAHPSHRVLPFPPPQEAKIAPIIADYWERAEFPFTLVPGFQKLGIGGGHLQGHGCQGLSVMAAAMAAVELVRLCV